MAKSSDFKTEDFVVYPTHGVGKVLGTEKQEIAGTELDLLVILYLGIYTLQVTYLLYTM